MVLHSREIYYSLFTEVATVSQSWIKLVNFDIFFIFVDILGGKFSLLDILEDFWMFLVHFLRKVRNF